MVDKSSSMHINTIYVCLKSQLCFCDLAVMGASLISYSSVPSFNPSDDRIYT